MHEPLQNQINPLIRINPLLIRFKKQINPLIRHNYKNDNELFLFFRYDGLMD